MGSSSSDAETTPHALLVPGRGQGHINGAMQLSQSLVPLGFAISFVYFSTDYAKLKQRNRLVLPESLVETGDPASQSSGSTLGSTTISSTFQNLSTSGSSVLRGGGKGTISVHVVEDGFEPGDDDKPFFVTAAMKNNLHKLVLELRELGQPPTCLISDSFGPWTLEVAQHLGIPRIEFWTSNALSHLLLFNIAPLYSQGILPEKGSPTQWKRETPLMLNHIPGLPPLSSELMPKEIRFGGLSHFLVQFCIQVASCVKSAERLLIHSMVELEPSAFKGFKLQGIPAYAIGPLPSGTEKQESKQADCITWLNLQVDLAVVYVAFGSAARFSVEEMQELAMGLEASGHPFLWVIREDAYGREELAQVLPDGFIQRTSGKGLIIGWAPQVQVLGHRAIGGFLSHCGWNSTLESMWSGVPMLCCPRFAEQRLNSHYLCNEWGAGLELGRTDTGGLERSSVETGISALLQSEDGVKARSKAQEIMQIARRTCQPEGQSFTNLQKFYNDMRELATKSSSKGGEEVAQTS